MRKEYYNYMVKMPAVIHEMFRQKVFDNHFLDMKTVITYLLKSYIRMCNRQKVSRATRLVLSRMKKNPDLEFFFRHQEKSVFAFEMDYSLVDDLQNAIKVSGLGNRTKLAIHLICSFISSTDKTLQTLAGEIPVGFLSSDAGTYLIHTYVSNYQYVFLKETAEAGNMKVEGMLTAAAELLVRKDTDIGYYTPDALQNIAKRVLAIQGSTLKDFRRQRIVSIRTNTIGSERILLFMREHNISSYREFLRRVVLFFLEARYLIYKKEIEIQEDDLPEDIPSEWEETMYQECSRKDFARSIYV